MRNKVLDRLGLSTVAPWERPSASPEELEGRLRVEGHPDLGSREPALALSPEAFKVLIEAMDAATLRQLAQRLYDQGKTDEVVIASFQAWSANLQGYLQLGPVPPIRVVGK